MRVFVTGATGWVGSAVLQELLASGHQVLGLARSDTAAAGLTATGAAVHRGSLEDLGSLRGGAAAADGVIHTAFIHDWSQIVASVETDRQAVEAMAQALEGSNKPFLIASGTMLIAALGRLGVETDAPPNPDAPRVASETIVLNAPGVRGAVVRLPPTVHGAGNIGFIGRLVQIARKNGAAAYIGDGANRWPAVHRLDAARVFVRGLEKAAPGSRLHAVAEAGVPMRAIAETIGQGLGLPVRSVTQEEASGAFDSLGAFVGTDNPTSGAITQHRLGWTPREIDLLADIKANYLV